MKVNKTFPSLKDKDCLRGKKIPLDAILEDASKTYRYSKSERNIHWANKYLRLKIYFKAKKKKKEEAALSEFL